MGLISRKFVEYPDEKLKRTEINCRRYYTNGGDILFPSVTTVLGALPNPALDAWREALGEELAAEEGRRAAARGTRIHDLYEAYILGKNPTPEMFDVEMFNNMKPYLDKITVVHALEKFLYSRNLKMAGTVDCIGVYKGKLCIIDFKTSKGLKYKDMISSYFIQCTAYSIMFQELYGVVIEDIVILMGNDYNEVQVFEEKRKNWLKPLKEAIKHFHSTVG